MQKKRKQVQDCEFQQTVAGFYELLKDLNNCSYLTKDSKNNQKQTKKLIQNKPKYNAIGRQPILKKAKTEEPPKQDLYK